MWCSYRTSTKFLFMLKSVVRSIPAGACNYRKMHDQPPIASGAEYSYLSGLFQQVGEFASENSNYFNQKQKHGHADYKTAFQTILNVLDPLQISLEVVTSCCGKFDVSPNCKGNGYRSIISIVQSCLDKILLLSMQIKNNRDKLFFRSYHVYMELESYTQVLSRLLTIIHLTIVLMDYSDVGCLFPHDHIVEDLLVDFEKVSRECFYGRSFGFQYAESVHQSLQVVAVALAAYGDGYIRHNHSFSRVLSSMLHSGKYMIDPELRAKRITELTQHADIDFCRAFWSLTEEHGVQHAPMILCPTMAINSEFLLPTNSVSSKSDNGREVTVEFPRDYPAHNGVKVRLLSYVWRDGQSLHEKEKTPLVPKPSPKSRYLMIHCHGGGFVAQSSKSHEIYLRYWAKELKIPILSIDYSLAPDAPYPQALNEIYFAYIWALNNLHKLGSTGEKICFSGDSAGANLVTGLALKVADAGLRPPDSVVVAYPPYRLQFLPSPSRILSLMDPLLPLGVLKSCIQAYVGGKQKSSAVKQIHSFGYGGDAYNPYDVDIVSGSWPPPYNHYKLDHSHSFSESNLNTIKARLLSKHRIPEEDQESFYSDFPYSESTSSMMEGDNLSMDEENDDTSEDEFLSFTANKGGCSTKIDRVMEKKSGSPSFLSSLTSHVSTKVQDLTSSVTNILYRKDAIASEVETSADKNRKPGMNCAVRDIEISAHQATTVRDITTRNQKSPLPLAHELVPEENVNPCEKSDSKTTVNKSTFSICKKCLHPSQGCCCVLPNKPRSDLHRRVSDRHRSSHHHKNYMCYSPRVRSKSYSDDEDMSTRCKSVKRTKSLNYTRTREDVVLNSNGSPLRCDNQCRNMPLSLNLSSEYATDTNTPRSDSPRIIYDKSTDSCVILTPKAENNENSSTGKEIINVMRKTFEDAKDPYMSPYLASDDMLKKLPPMTIVACSLDPLLDDSVEFIRKLHKLNKPAELYILDKLPHGFLNLHVFSNEAREGCDLLIACIKKSLGMGMRGEDSSTSINSKTPP